MPTDCIAMRLESDYQLSVKTSTLADAWDWQLIIRRYRYVSLGVGSACRSHISLDQLSSGLLDHFVEPDFGTNHTQECYGSRLRRTSARLINR